MSQPMLGITLGDPSGIGPEVVAATLARIPDEWKARLVVYGDMGPLERGARAMGVTLPNVRIVASGLGESAVAGRPDEAAGSAQVAYLDAAISDAQAGRIAGIVTAPISKTWARRGGFEFLGHTEMLAARFAASEVAMMFRGPKFTVVLATVHVPLLEVLESLSTARIRAVIQLLIGSLSRDFAIARPRIGVLGLNPHAGEDGLLGDEDLEIIKPAIELPYGEAIVTGPLVPDTAFRNALDGRYDGMVAMYHDQALIPVKLVDFEESVNVTLGLPIVRTSPDHGTAYDIAGTGKARSTSTERALSLAMAMVNRRSRD